ncbi:MAG: TIR domain-containing protein, partial [Gammaproteobacteria bacterium]|nr:TIR domain-containing protein [Gammaproteobacteria bacterium]
MMKHDVFVSYASRDRDIARKVCAALEAAGVPCWIAPRNIPFGADYASSLIEAIGKSHVVVSIFSSNANRSSHVRREIERAASKDKSIIVFRCEQVPFSPALEYFLSDAQWLDAAESLDERIRELCERIPSIVREAKTRTGYAGTLDDRVEEGHREITLDEHDQTVAANPDDPAAWHDRAFAHFQKGDNAMAIADCDRALELDATMAVAFNLRGMAHFNLGRYAEALNDLDEALRLAPEYTMAFILKGI